MHLILHGQNQKEAFTWIQPSEMVCFVMSSSSLSSSSGMGIPKLLLTANHFCQPAPLTGETIKWHMCGSERAGSLRIFEPYWGEGDLFFPFPIIFRLQNIGPKVENEEPFFLPSTQKESSVEVRRETDSPSLSPPPPPTKMCYPSSWLWPGLCIEVCWVLQFLTNYTNPYTNHTMRCCKGEA